MEGINYVMGFCSAFTNRVEVLLLAFNLQPSSYSYFFPATIIDPSKIEEMVQNNVFPTVPRLAPAFTYALLLGFIRLFLHHVFFKPLAIYTMSIKLIHLPVVSEIETAFPNTRKKYETAEVNAFCRKSTAKLETAFVHKYLWTRRRNNAMQRKMAKFAEAFWRFIFYTLFCVVGYFTLFQPELALWVADTRHNWIKWPEHPMTSMLEFYYQVELGCYFHQLMWTEIHRSDAAEMILHHLTTIALVMSSYLTNFTRIGSSILLLHDLSDVFLESAKVMNYISLANSKVRWLKICCDSLFVVFAITFVITRLYIYPRYVISSVLFEASVEFGREWIGYWAFVVMLVTLQLLHIFWFYLIARMVYKMVALKCETDERSDVEEDFGDEYESDDDDDDDGSKNVASPDKKKQ